MQSLQGPVFSSAEECSTGVTGAACPLGDVEAGFGVGVLSLGGAVVEFEGLEYLASCRLLLGPRGAGPVNEKSLSTDFAANITHGIGKLAENLHGELVMNLSVLSNGLVEP